MATTAVVLAYIGAAAAVAGAGVAIYSAQEQASNQRAMNKYQAAVARNNEIISERAARDAEERGKIAERQKRVEANRLKGRQRAALAGAGQVVDIGSALSITADTAQFGEQDALTIRSLAEREAAGFRTQGMNFASSGQAALLQGQQAQSTATLNSLSTALTTTSTVSSRWNNFRSQQRATQSSTVK